MGNENFRRELNDAFDAMSSSPSPALRDRVRSSLIDAPERRGPYWIAGVAAAVMAAVIVGILFVANPGNRHPNVAPGGPHVTPSASPAASPSPTSAVSPTPQYTCDIAGVGTKPPTTPSAPPVAFIDAVRTGTHTGYDRLTMQYNNGFPNSVDVKPQSSTTFTGSPSGQAVTVAGQKGILVVIHGADAHTAYSGSSDIKTGYQGLVEVRVVEDFEGTVQLGLGVSGTGCYNLSFLDNPARVIIDIQVG